MVYVVITELFLDLMQIDWLKIIESAFITDLCD